MDWAPYGARFWATADAYSASKCGCICGCRFGPVGPTRLAPKTCCLVQGYWELWECGGKVLEGSLVAALLLFSPPLWGPLEFPADGGGRSMSQCSIRKPRSSSVSIVLPTMVL